jgi:putative ABC transport system permease protein
MVPASPGAFRSLGLPLLTGRDLQAGDRSGTGPVAVLNESAARQLFGSRPPVGRRFYFGSANDPLVWTTVVGVVPDVVPSVSLTRVRAAFFVPWEQQSWWDSEVWLVMRMKPGVAYPERAVREALAASSPEASLTETRAFQSYLDAQIAMPRLLAASMSLFSLMAFVIALLGLFSIVTYSAARRTRELGIRMALGADPRGLGRWAMTEPGIAALAGTVTGLFATVLVGARLRELLFEIGPSDPITLLGVALLTMGCSLVAAWAPIRRALQVSPLTALRHE